MNGDLLTTEILVGQKEGEPKSHGVFYSIIDPEEESVAGFYFKAEKGTDGKITLTAESGYVVDPTEIAKDDVARVKVTKDGVVVYDEVIKNY